MLFKKCFNPHNTIHLKLANELNLLKLKFYFTAAAISVARAIIAKLAGNSDNKDSKQYYIGVPYCPMQIYMQVVKRTSLAS